MNEAADAGDVHADAVGPDDVSEVLGFNLDLQQGVRALVRGPHRSRGLDGASHHGGPRARKQPQEIGPGPD